MFRAATELERALQRYERMAPSDKQVVQDLRDTFLQVVPNTKDALAMRALNRRIGEVAQVAVHDAPTLVEAVVEQRDTWVLAARDPTPLAENQVFGGVAPEKKTVIVELQGGTSAPPPLHADWTLAAAVDKFGADVDGRRWETARAVVYTRRPRPQIVVVTAQGMPPQGRSTVEDRLGALEGAFGQFRSMEAAFRDLTDMMRDLREQSMVSPRKRQRNHQQDDVEDVDRRQHGERNREAEDADQYVASSEPLVASTGQSAQPTSQPPAGVPSLNLERLQQRTLEGFPGPHHN